MKRKWLRELELSEEQVDAVMKKYGEKKQSYLKTIEELENASEDLATIKKERDEFKAQAEKVPTLEEQTAKLTEELNGRDMKFAIERELQGKAHDVDLVLGMLDASQLALKDGAVEGLAEQVNALKESKGFLFVPEEEPTEKEPDEPVHPIFTPGQNPQTNKTDGASVMESKLAEYKARFQKGD